MVRRKKRYFETVKGAPSPIIAEISRTVRFSDADPMAIMWHGRYPLLFEEASEELGRRCGLSYQDYYDAGLRGPIVSIHIDYHLPLVLAEEFTVRASLVWAEGARINTEFQISKADGQVATTGYTVQLFTDHLSGAPCMVTPELLERCRQRWRAGEFACYQ
ncbi:MAG: acyl-CoA thioesterase [Geobacteraceae bacterium]|nr:acyl-CoA thioesterase [Geobacteraceae bacterium]